MPATAGPDLIIPTVGVWFPDETGIKKWGTEDGVTAYTAAAFSCNIGDQNLPWNGFTDQHPALVQNIYRLENGRLDQIGASPVKHVVATVPQDLFCSNSCNWPGSFILGVGCSDPYDADRNGQQDRLGPRSEINPTLGTVPYPFTGENISGGVLDKRIRVRNADLDPAQHASARFFVGGQYVSEADTNAGNQYNNAAYREIQPGAFAEGGWELLPAGDSVGETTILDAWQTADPGVLIAASDTPAGGRYLLGSRATPNGDGSWHYEYALLNYNDDRAAAGFRVPAAGCAPTNIGFQSPDQDPIEGIANTPWAAQAGPDGIAWSCPPFAADPDANALRWGLLFSCRFDSACAPMDGDAAIVLFAPGTPGELPVAAVVPEPSGAGCLADLAPPAGVLDLADVQAFVGAFVGSDPLADLVPPNGVLDLADLQAFVTAFVAGCP